MIRSVLTVIRRHASFAPFPLLVASLALCPSNLTAAPKYFLQRPLVTLNLEYEREDEERTGPTTSDKTERKDTFRQGLEIDGAGWWYHPNLVTFKYALEPEWQQQSTRATGDFEQDNDIVFFGYFLDAVFLREKPQSLELFLNQSRNTFDSTLSPDNDTETTVARATWRLKEYAVPTSVSIARYESDFQNLFTIHEVSESLRVDSKHKTDKSLSILRTEYLKQEREISTAESSVERILLNATNRYRFSEDVLLASFVSGMDSTSDTGTETVDNNRYVLSESLFLQHRPNLRGNYELRMEQRELDDFTTDSVLASATLQHQLYENLETTINVEGRQDDTSDGEIDVIDSDLGFRYTRKLPIGMLNITNGYNYRLEDSDIDAVISQVIDEPVVTQGTQLLFLDKLAIDVTSIVVTDITAVIIYVEGIDYVVTQVGSSVAIQPTLFGGIADGQTLLVSYSFAAQAPFKLGRKGLRFGVSVQLWNALRLFYNYGRTREDLISGTRPSELADDTIQRAGAQFKWRWSTTYVEFLDQDTVRAPFERLRVTEALRFRPRRNLSFGLSAGYAETEFKDETGNDSTSYDFGANFRWQINAWNHFQATAFFQSVEGESQDSEATGFTALWGWRYADWSGSVRYQSLDQDDSLVEQTRERDLFTVRISRTFR